MNNLILQNLPYAALSCKVNISTPATYCEEDVSCVMWYSRYCTLCWGYYGCCSITILYTVWRVSCIYQRSSVRCAPRPRGGDGGGSLLRGVLRGGHGRCVHERLRRTAPRTACAAARHAHTVAGWKEKQNYYNFILPNARHKRPLQNEGDQSGHNPQRWPSTG